MVYVKKGELVQCCSLGSFRCRVMSSVITGTQVLVGRMGIGYTMFGTIAQRYIGGIFPDDSV